MPNAHSPDKRTLAFYIPRTLARRLQKRAARLGKTLTEFLTDLFTDATRDVELTPQDLQEIARDREEALAKRRRKAGAPPRPTRA